MNVISQTELSRFREENTRPVHCPDGVTRNVLMSPSMWIHYEFVMVFEPMSAEDISKFAFEEMERVGCDFDTAFHRVVSYLTNLWTD